GIRQPVFASEVDGRVWSAIVIFSHAEQSSERKIYFPGNLDTEATTNLYKTLSMALLMHHLQNFIIIPACHLQGQSGCTS
ncbi:hypothetical protein KJR85_28130, partial [Klebsiella pneumoniae]